MSAAEVREQIKIVQESITSVYSTTYRIGLGIIVTYYFLEKVNLLLESYGAFLGKAKAKHSDYLEEIGNIDKEIKTYFEHMTKSSESNFCLKLVNLGIGKISELLSFIEELDASTPEKKVSKRTYEKLLKENEVNKRMIETLVKYKGLPELNQLLEKARKVKLPTDEHWVLALCSANLIEAIVNKKLEELKVSKEGNFEKRYKRLVKSVKETEKRDISQLLPVALYKGVRNKLDHASQDNRVTPKEANQISKIVINLITEVFQ